MLADDDSYLITDPANICVGLGEITERELDGKMVVILAFQVHGKEIRFSMIKEVYRELMRQFREASTVMKTMEII